MNYASLYNMRSCFTVKRGGDPRDPWHRRRRRCCYGMTIEEDTAAPRERKRERERNTSRINFAIGEFYVRAGSIYYGRAFAATSIHRVWTDRLVLGLAPFLFFTRGPRRIGDQQFCLCSSFAEYLILAGIKLNIACSRWILHIFREIWSPSLNYISGIQLNINYKNDRWRTKEERACCIYYIFHKWLYLS